MAHGRSTDHAGSKNKERSRFQSKARKLKCYYCHKEGHYRKDCPEHKGKKKDSSKMDDAGVVEDNSNGADVLSITISSSDGGWILDTGYSYHMCPNRDWFATYRSFDDGKEMSERHWWGLILLFPKFGFQEVQVMARGSKDGEIEDENQEEEHKMENGL
ncbi:hypothetical protein RJ639_026723 [Escallonia herrerae]|uniref:CCHC-type domain-containing protein n=1 Tax=Escallonia herrerae TaxID=1293975 RepID=A0AA89BR58_9ASTE|nr:hypothetical protein RJ639_026723 [Escallonia herrerae]